jgi:predicted Zn finger-like uncharacterized protein
VKFVCDNCKAKYQIGDDKVSGKTVRMKCRKCGHLILVSAAVTESSVSRAAPAEGTQLGGSAPGASSPGGPSAGATVSTAPPDAHGPPPGAAPDPGDDEDGQTMIMKVPPRVPARPAAPARPTTGGLRVPAAPRPSTSGAPAVVDGAAPSPAPPQASPRPSSATPRPPAARPSIPRAGVGGLSPTPAPSAPSLGDLAQRSMASAISTAARSSLPAAPVAPPRSLSPAPGGVAAVGAAPSATVAPGGGVAGAFQRAVAGTQPVLRPDTPGEDWYVGVGGVPLGPVRLSVIREKVDQGAVDGESLVWREGFDEWQPLRMVPGLRAILDERRATAPPEAPRGSSSSLARVGAPTPIPGAMHVGAVPASAPSTVNGTNGHGAMAVGHVPTGGVSLGPAAAPPAATLASASAPPAEPAPAESVLATAAVAAAASGAAASTAPAAASAAPSPSAALSPAATPGTTASGPSVPPPSREGRKGMHPFAYAMIAMAAMFGAVAAWVLLKPAPQQVIVVQTAAPADPGLAAAPPPPPTSEPTAEPSAGAEPKAGGAPKQGSGQGSRATNDAAPPSKGGDAPSNLGSSFDQGVAGPTAGPGDAQAGSGRGQLSEGEINGVVQRNMASVRRRCWQPALDARSASAPKSARVSTTITIGPSGSVSSASASGSETHFPGLSACIGGAIRGWKFPPSDGSTTVNIPFSFNAQ